MNAVTVKNAVKSFGSKIVLNNLNFTLSKGKITGLIGFEGAGKTTLLKTIIGQINLDKGEIDVLGFNPELQKEKLNLHICCLPQKFELYEKLTVIENLCLISDLKTVKKKAKEEKCDKYNKNIQNILKITGLVEFQAKPVNILQPEIRQKLGIACALIGEPDFVLLDEPDYCLESEQRKAIIKILKNTIFNKTTILYATQSLEEALLFDSVIVLDKGKIIYQGRPYDLAPTPTSFENKILELTGKIKKDKNEKIEKIEILKEIKHVNKIKSLSKKPIIQPVFKTSSFQKINDNADYIIEIDSLSKRYGSNYVIKNINLKIKKGEIYGIIGLEGSGKSTLLKIMSALIKPTSGTVRIMDIDIKNSPEKIRADLGYMSQKFSLYNSLSIRQNLDFFALAYGIKQNERKSKVDDIIETFGLKDYQNTKTEELPQGIKQRLSMASAIIHNPKILFLDEPVSNTDIFTRKDLWNHISDLSKKGVTVVVASQIKEEAEYCDRVCFLHNAGIIIEGSPVDIKNKTKSKNMEKSFMNLIKK